MNQVRGGVVAHGVGADVGVHHRIDAIADHNVLLGLHAMRAHALHRGIASDNFCDNDVAAGVVKPAAIANLATGFSIEGCVIEDDLALFSGADFSYSTKIFDHCQHRTVACFGPAVADELSFYTYWQNLNSALFKRKGEHPPSQLLIYQRRTLLGSPLP